MDVTLTDLGFREHENRKCALRPATYLARVGIVQEYRIGYVRVSSLNLTGDYVWRQSRRFKNGKFRPIWLPGKP